ncbi:DNA/RNA helicase domain-containing protein [Cellulomonas sp. CW35]|uniref:DNA/RNA helicase domain-containing protein n=1 Tax=Cellulomonas sp. CW35 TaxID=3458249 RepID=UPI0040334DA6
MPTARYSGDALARVTSDDDTAVERHLAQMLSAQGIPPGPSERRAWRHSVPALARDLDDAGLGNVEVLLEHRLPLSSRRTDAVLAGVHPRTGEPSYVVVELKQWTEARRWEDSETLVDVPGAPYRPVLHPGVQVEEYVRYLADFVRALEHAPHTITGLAYLHNASDEPVADLLTGPAPAPVFTGQRRARLHEHLRSVLSVDAPGRESVQAADAFLSSSIAPSRQLLSVAADEIRDREQFVLLDEQRVAFDLVLREVAKARRADSKSVVLVTGGPGSGKSVIALSLLGELAREGRSVLHATGSRSFTQTLRKVAGRGSPRTAKLFTYFNAFMDADRNGLDVLVLDEAHRIREKSVQRFTPARLRERARPQVDELLDAARVPVFLLDQHQVVRPGELGSPADIRAAAARRGLPVHEVRLDAQFRAGGSQAYVEWVERLLGLREPEVGPVPWPGDEGFVLDVVDSPDELEGRLGAYTDAGYGARITAGYCWPWSDPRPDGSLVPDVRIDGWSRPWNLRGDRSVGGAPPAALWASDPAGFGQVGCIYTAQGFEYDWNGVVIGPDLVWRADRGGWVARREHSRDPDFRSRRAVPDDEFARLVRNVYKVLLTRGMVGTLVYSTDPDTRTYLRTLVPRR